jgi:acetaldehyde dehydrogenase (acetylating)
MLFSRGGSVYQERRFTAGKNEIIRVIDLTPAAIAVFLEVEGSAH